VKVAALLFGVLASALAWAGSQWLAPLEAEFLALWAPTNSQQLFGSISWHAIAAAGLVGGMVTVLSPLLGGIILLIAAGAWAGIGLTLPYGFGLQVIAPLVLAGIGAIAAFGALVRGAARRNGAKQRPNLEDAARASSSVGSNLSASSRAVETRNERSVAEPAESEGPARPDSAPISVERRQPEQAGPPRGLSGLFVANVAVLLLLSGAVALLLYSGLRSGQLAAAFAPSPTVTTVPAAPETTESADEGAAAAASSAEAGPVVETASAAVAAPAPEQWTDQFAYCTAVRTADFPDGRYAGPALTAEIADALRVPVSSSPDRAKWRCHEGAVLGCASFGGPRCAMTPTVPEMLEFCARNPGATGLLAPNGSWSCDDTEPAVPAGESWPMDARGFLPGAWIEITPNPAATAG
jgi:hypothetical protein